MKKWFCCVSILIVSISIFGIPWPLKKKSVALAAEKDTKKQSTDVHAEINTLINTIEQLKKENESLRAGKVVDKLTVIDQEKSLNNASDILKDIDRQEDSREEELNDLKKQIHDLKQQVDYLGHGWINTLKTFEANIKAPAFSKFLSENLENLDDKTIAKKINEEMANAIYRLKFMYTESQYLLNWMNKKINWKSASEKGITKPELTKDFTEAQIKTMVMAVEVQ